MGRKPTDKGLWNKLSGLFKSAATEPESTGFFRGGMPGELQVPWIRNYGRKQLEADLNKMDMEDGIVGSALDKMADFATCWEDEEQQFGFKLRLAESTDPKKISKYEQDAIDHITAVANDCGLQEIDCWDMFRAMVKKGNVFTENIVDNYTLSRVSMFPESWQIEKHEDKSGNLLSGAPTLDPKEAKKCAYVQVNDLGNPVAAFWPYQVTHWMFGAREGKTYVEPMLGKETRDWKKLRAQEDALGVARVTKAWDTRVHKVLMPVGSSQLEVDEKISAYKKAMESDSITSYDSGSGNFQSIDRKSPMNAQKDFYVSAYYTSEGKVIEGSVENLNPSTAALDSINDIYWGVTRLLVTLGMPMDHIGLKVGQRAFIDKSSEKGLEAFSRFIKRLQCCHAYGVKQLLDMELLLAGFDPRKIDYKIVYPSIVPQSAEMSARILLNKAQAANYWSQMGIPQDLIAKHLLNFDPEAIQAWQAAVKNQINQTTSGPTNQPKPANPAKKAPQEK